MLLKPPVIRITFQEMFTANACLFTLDVMDANGMTQGAVTAAQS
jgi:hypothetical protein